MFFENTAPWGQPVLDQVIVEFENCDNGTFSEDPGPEEAEKAETLDN